MQKYKLTFVLLTVCVIFSTQLSSADLGGWLRWAPYGQPLYADTHADACRLDISALTMNPAYDYGQKGTTWQAHVWGLFGFNLPVYSWDSPDNRFGISLALPLSAHLWMDLGEPSTAAIVNTDYRIAGPTITFIHRLNHGFAQNYSISWHPFRHESTHVGDELVLQRSDMGYGLRRVNVSYNYTELQFTFNEPENREEQNHTFRLAIMIPFNWSKGWYFVEERDGEIQQIGDGQYMIDSKGREKKRGPAVVFPECYLQYQYQTPTHTKSGIQGVLSIEGRLRAQYGYELTSMKGDYAGAGEDKPTLTGNLFIGMRCNKCRDGYFGRTTWGIRAYYGNCPYGQFRSVKDYAQIGVCLIVQ